MAPIGKWSAPSSRHLHRSHLSCLLEQLPAAQPRCICIAGGSKAFHHYAVQSCMRSPGTRPNSRVFAVTSTAPRLRACAAMSTSWGPIGVPARSVAAYVTRLLRVFQFKWQSGQIKRQECSKHHCVLLRSNALFDAIPYFIKNDYRHRDNEPLCECLLQSRAHHGLAPVDCSDDSIGIQAYHCSNSLDGNGIGGCSGRPSGKKSAPPERSISAKIALTDSRSRSSGSKRTPRPTRRTRTSLPGKRNSFGSRTAWLRPCLKSLAVATLPVMTPIRAFDRYPWYLSSNSAPRNWPIQERPSRGSPP